MNTSNGRGYSISFTARAVATVTDCKTLKNEGKDGYPRGFVSSTTGLVKVRLTGAEADENIYTLAGAHMMYEVETLYDDGAVPITDIMLFW